MEVNVDMEENRKRMRDGELYHAFTPDLIADRRKCRSAYTKYNAAGDVNRRTLVEMLQELTRDETTLPPPAPTEDEDDEVLQEFPWVDSPVRMDYGYNVKFGQNVYVNHSSTWIDTCPIEVGSRTLIGPNCSFFSGSHPLDPAVRNGTKGPEWGKPVKIGADCWFGGSCIVLPGVTIGRGSTVGAGSVVTKDVPEYVVVAGNPARIVRYLKKPESETGESRFLR